jgi:hypothetical protein
MLTQFIFSQTSQPDTTRMKKITLNEVVISVNKTAETQRTVAQHVQVLTAKEGSFHC